MLRPSLLAAVFLAAGCLSAKRTGQGETALVLDPASPADVLAAATTRAPGSYVIRWQVLSVDGHITRGDVPLIVQAP